MDRKSKTIFQLDTPYTSVQWPQLSPQDQETILELVISLLSPVGHHRLVHTIPSNGKRSKKRKRQEVGAVEINPQIETWVKAPLEAELSPYLLIGLASITRHLELLSRTIKPKQSQREFGTTQSNDIHAVEVVSTHTNQCERGLPMHVVAVFVSRSSQPSVLHAHFPQLIATASLAHPDAPATRLVQLPQGCENRVSASLGLPRASFVGILESAPHSEHLVTLIRELVPPIEVPWLQEVQNVEYKPLKVNFIPTTAPKDKGVKKAK